jgi:hypothetical protein
MHPDKKGYYLYKAGTQVQGPKKTQCISSFKINVDSLRIGF